MTDGIFESCSDLQNTITSQNKKVLRICRIQEKKKQRIYSVQVVCELKLVIINLFRKNSHLTVLINCCSAGKNLIYQHKLNKRFPTKFVCFRTSLIVMSPKDCNSKTGIELLDVFDFIMVCITHFKLFSRIITIRTRYNIL